MTKIILCSIGALIFFNSCAKDSGTPDPDFLKSIEDKLASYVWHPVTTEDENKRISYKPDDCEMDNSYTFSFQERSSQMNLNRGAKSCSADVGLFEKSVFKEKNTNGFTLNKENGTIKFSDSDEYSYYLVVVDGDELVMTSQNNNPAANYVAMKYSFKGAKR